MTAISQQVGGTHYKGMRYEPVELASRADLNFFQSNIIKYVTRFRLKDGKKDLEKVIHYAYLGHELNPKNHVMHNGSKELIMFVRENEIDPEIGNICYQTMHQNWLSIVSLTKLLIEREYGDETPKE